jgi:hypothetical protein
MPDYTFTMPDGSVFDATAGTWEEAHKAVKDAMAQEKTVAANKEYTDAPITSKARMLVGDPINQIVHGLTAGLFDKGFDAATGAKSAADTAAGAERMGPTATGVSRAAGAMLLPSAAPRAVAAVGGGPVMRTLTGATVAGTEGGVYGGVNAATQGEDVPTGILGGAVGGAVVQPVAQAVGNSTNKIVKAVRGIDDAAPKNSMVVLPTGRTPTPTDYVNVAAAKADAVAAQKGMEAGQQAQRNEFSKLLGPKSKVIDPATGKASERFTPTQKERMRAITEGDPGTKLAEGFGDFLKNKFVAGGLGVSTGGLVPGILATGGSVGAGKIMTRDSAAATQEAVDALRQLMYKKKPFRGPMSPERIRTLGQGLGYGAGAGVEDYLD